MLAKAPTCHERLITKLSCRRLSANHSRSSISPDTATYPCSSLLSCSQTLNQI
jgi:hypothetical protein